MTNMMPYPKVQLPELNKQIKAAAKLRSQEGRVIYFSLCDLYHKVTMARFRHYMATRPAINPLTGNLR